jgi:hypothetical protein
MNSLVSLSETNVAGCPHSHRAAVQCDVTLPDSVHSNAADVFAVCSNVVTAITGRMGRTMDTKHVSLEREYTNYTSSPWTNLCFLAPFLTCIVFSDFAYVNRRQMGMNMSPTHHPSATGITMGQTPIICDVVENCRSIIIVIEGYLKFPFDQM